MDRATGKRRVLVIGGGLAGLSAAECLARQFAGDFQIVLLEAKRSVGGRAGSFVDPHSDQTVDYCQHVMMGCCTNAIGLLERCGLGSQMHRYKELSFLHRDFAPSHFSPSSFLPAPLHLASSVASLRFLDRPQRRLIRRAMFRMFRSHSESLRSVTAGQWLRDQGQDEATIRDFWGVVLVSALGEHVDLVSMQAARKVFVDGFAAARDASDVLVPRLPLAELFGHRLRRAIEDLGVAIHDSTQVSSVMEVDGVVTTVCSNRDTYQSDHVVMAVPWHSIDRLVSTNVAWSSGRYATIPSSPITGLHLWFDQQITDQPHAVMVGTVSQWLFRQPWGENAEGSTVDGSAAVDSIEESARGSGVAGSSGCYYQVVISASQQARSMPKEELLETVLAELKSIFPLARQAKLLNSRVVTDPNSVFSMRPEVESIRPSARTALPWLHLAGDWIDTGWPATMEGAVISGRLAASSITQREGMSAVPVDPGLARGWLSRWLIRS